MRSWGLRGLVRPRGVGLGEPDLRQVRVFCRILYFQVGILKVRGGGREGLPFRSCPRCAGRGFRVGGRDWAWWSGKTLGLVDFGVVL